MEGNPNNFYINSDPRVQREHELLNEKKVSAFNSMKEELEKRKDFALETYNKDMNSLNDLKSEILKKRGAQHAQESYDKEIAKCDELLENLTREQGIS